MDSYKRRCSFYRVEVLVPDDKKHKLGGIGSYNRRKNGAFGKQFLNTRSIRKARLTRLGNTCEYQNSHRQHDQFEKRLHLLASM
jgi:hypothetical protein